MISRAWKNIRSGWGIRPRTEVGAEFIIVLMVAHFPYDLGPFCPFIYLSLNIEIFSAQLRTFGKYVKEVKPLEILPYFLGGRRQALLILWSVSFCFYVSLMQ